MALHGALSGERRRDHHGLEMHVVLAFDQRLAPAKPPSIICATCCGFIAWLLDKLTQAYPVSFAHDISSFTDEGLVDLGRQALAIEIDGLRAQLPRSGSEFARACRICLGCHGRIVVTGMGKSGHIGGKIAATLASTGTPAFFVHPGEASHGDVGMITRDDAVLALSNSGETAEILTIVPAIARLGVPLIALTGNAGLHAGANCHRASGHRRARGGLPAEPRAHREHHGGAWPWATRWRWRC